jgi:uncharacterized protein DUF3551
MRIPAFALALATAAAFAPRPAAAAYNLPWCAQYYDRSAVRSCAFFTYEQCRTTMSGIGGFCFRNPFGPPVAYGEPRRAKRHYYDRPY